MESTLRTDAINLLKTSYKFRLDIQRLYDDIQTVIKKYLKNKTLIEREVWGNYEQLYSNQLILQYHFAINKDVFGVSLLVSIDEKWIKTGNFYNRFITELDIDAQYPLVAIFGRYEPINLDSYLPKDWFMVVTGLCNWHEKNLKGNSYTFNEFLEIKSNIPQEETIWFQSCIVKIKKMLEIKTQDDIKQLVEDLFSLTTG